MGISIGKEYAVYFPEGGEVKIDLADLNGEPTVYSDRFNVEGIISSPPMNVGDSILRRFSMLMPAESLITNNRYWAKTVKKFRKDYLDDCAQRMDWNMN